MFPDVLCTAVPSIAHIEQNIADGRAFFTDLPCLVGNPVLHAWWCALAHAALEGAVDRTSQLLEAGRTVTVRRMRLNPSRKQILLDSLAWSETVRTVEAACGDSLLDTVRKVLAIPEVASAASVPKTRAALQACGVTVQGKPVSEVFASSIAAMKPHVGDPNFLAEYADLLGGCPILTYNFTKIGVCAKRQARFPGAHLLGMLGAASSGHKIGTSEPK